MELGLALCTKSHFCKKKIIFIFNDLNKILFALLFSYSVQLFSFFDPIMNRRFNSLQITNHHNRQYRLTSMCYNTFENLSYTLGQSKMVDKLPSFVRLWFIVSLENFSLIWRRQHCRWRAANFELCSALMAIEQ